MATQYSVNVTSTGRRRFRHARRAAAARGLTGVIEGRDAVSDITYVRTWQAWLYLAVILDAFAIRRRTSRFRAGPRRRRGLCSIQAGALTAFKRTR